MKTPKVCKNPEIWFNKSITPIIVYPNGTADIFIAGTWWSSTGTIQPWHKIARKHYLFECEIV